MTTDEPALSDASSWLTIGARAVDTGTGRTGVVLLLRDAAGNVHTEGIERPVRALLRCEGRREPRWWAEVGELRSAP
ncbi:hypothetical protein CUT44_30075 [Streptomyces carminius]|uniref:Uncharacterized protein n=2 Tax=Streptomyces carminius TaxID=2665496 RepID=A0A2M8LRA1_9ACTN|nr:hypothetical protein CUT44_30075 [Streptomyces carminius]